ncbi:MULTISPECIES: NAD(P)H-dependent oxidoreductase [unclassified Chelatococcus]|uniref:NAD(P)H-dependent oxidoreductase n=1 Tax=unclassified Chelatococcus TaxID=2638111 RepID=UPI001BCEEA50|nr:MULTISPECIES: NAD(P)H-dependent oxidoreductase [unclassified Chelatococcus]MBS7696377.1 NAD(P)H-dependent oxidoreductase [Chelatococcus sp. YT9]MBX3556987.1 NAD(P)H-dependent oxidoreductase [Chelatococcus sp.]
MSRRIVIIQGHPDPDEQRLCRALADAYVEGAREAGHEISSVDLASLDVPFLRSQSSFENDSVPPNLKPAQEAILAAEHILIVFPLWLGTMPALVKAFLEQVMRPGFAFGYDKGVPRTQLTGRSARLVVTMSMPVLAYRWWYFGHGLKALQRNILRFVGISPVRESLFGMVTGVSDATRRKWLDDMRKLGRQGA